MIVTIKQWCRSWRLWFRNQCPDCETKLTEWGYCSPCNYYHYRDGIDDAEDIFLGMVADERRELAECFVCPHTLAEHKITKNDDDSCSKCSCSGYTYCPG